MQSPLCYLKGLVSKEFIIPQSNQLILAIKYLSSLDEFDQDFYDVIQNKIFEKSDSLYDAWVAYISDFTIKQTNAIYKDDESKQEFIMLSKNQHIKDLPLRNIQQQIINEIRTEFPSLKDNLFTNDFWHEIEFYMNSRHQNFKTLKQSRNMKPEQNDAGDLLNLIYVNNNQLYWTMDKRWINIFREAKLNRFIFTKDQ